MQHISIKLQHLSTESVGSHTSKVRTLLCLGSMVIEAVWTHDGLGKPSVTSTRSLDEPYTVAIECHILKIIYT
jgi:ABC-type dipeptide/oligopeptide/nickel transport system permease component